MADSEHLSAFVDELRRASEDSMTPGKPRLQGRRLKRLEARLGMLLAKMRPDEQHGAVRLAKSYAYGLEQRAYGRESGAAD